MDYNVVFKNTSGSILNGVTTWTSFESKDAFNKWYDKKMKKWYEVVEENVSQDRAIELCSTPEANTAVVVSHLKKISEIFA